MFQRATRVKRNFLSLKVMILRNHGIVICGETIEEALELADSAVRACKYQVKYILP